MSDLRDSILAAQQGDAPSLQSLFGRNLPQLIAFLRVRMGRLVSAKESVHDLAQSVCREVLQDLDDFEYRGDEAFRKYLFVQATRKILDKKKFYTRDRRDAAREVDVFANRDEGDQRESLLGAYKSIYSPTKIADGNEFLERIEDALTELPEAQRDAIALTRMMGLSTAEAAEQLGTTDAGVRGLVARGLARLSMRMHPGEA